MARNQTGSGVRVSWKIVPAVTEVWQPQAAHSSSTPRTVHDLPPPQRGHRNPSGHRSRTRYARQAASVEKEASSSVKFRGYSSTTPGHYPLWSPESSRYPSLAKLTRLVRPSTCLAVFHDSVFAST